MSAYLTISEAVQDALPCITKTEAVRFVVQGRINHANARGHGNAARRREELIALALEPAREPMTQEDFDRLAEHQAEGRYYGHPHINFHE